VKYYTFVTFLLPHHLSNPFFPLRTSTGQTPVPILMVDGSNDASLLKENPFGYGMVKKYVQGVCDPQNRRFFDRVGKSQPKLKRSITFERHVLATFYDVSLGGIF
jgi:hypothetical protein